VVRLADVCRHVRSKNAGPFWVTIDLFFDGPDAFATYANTDRLDASLFAALYGCDSALVKRIVIESLNMVRISFPCPHPQGWMGERDMHQGQSYVRLLGLNLG